MRPGRPVVFHQRQHWPPEGYGRSLQALRLKLRNELWRSKDRPVVVEPLLGQAAYRNAHQTAWTPGRAARLLHCQLGQCAEQRQLVRGHLPIPIEDALDLVDRASRPAGAKLEQEREPAHTRTGKRIVVVPAADQLEAHPLEQEVKEVLPVGHEQPPVSVPVPLPDVVPLQGQ